MQEDMPDESRELVKKGIFWLVPIPSEALPYQNPRRNAKLMKYTGHLIFQGVTTVIWQDAKFFRKQFLNKQPYDYHKLILGDACATAFALPAHSNTAGKSNPAVVQGLSKVDDFYKSHCNSVVQAVLDRADVTDSVESVSNQCRAYVQNIEQDENGNAERLDHGLIDSAFIIWNESNEFCRNFNSQLRCTMADHLHCHSDRDQISFPFVLYKMGLRAFYKGDKPADGSWNRDTQGLDFRYEEDSTSSIGRNIVPLR
jgi:hypothetical protein